MTDKELGDLIVSTGHMRRDMLTRARIAFVLGVVAAVDVWCGSAFADGLGCATFIVLAGIALDYPFWWYRDNKALNALRERLGRV